MALFAPPAWSSTVGTLASSNTAGFWMPAPAAVTQPAIRGLALARSHLARLARSAAPEPPEPLEEAPVAPSVAVATVREHRLRVGSRRRARPK